MADQPRFTLHPAHCANGISKSGAGFRVVHTASGKQIGVVAWVGDGWCYSHPADTGLTDDMLHHPTPEAAATALLAHDLDLNLARVRHRTLTAGADDVAEMAARI
jgi:hypothetical protein